jgi:hypothetical protein
MKRQQSGLGKFSREGSLVTQQSGSIKSFSVKKDGNGKPTTSGFVSSLWTRIGRLFNFRQQSRVTPGIAGWEEYYEADVEYEKCHQVNYRSPSMGDFEEDRSFAKHVLSQLKESNFEDDTSHRDVPFCVGDCDIVQRQHSGMPRIEVNRHLAIRVSMEEGDSIKSDFSSVWSGSISEWLPKMKLLKY